MLESWNFFSSSSDISDMLCLILMSGRTKYDFWRDLFVFPFFFNFMILHILLREWLISFIWTGWGILGASCEFHLSEKSLFAGYLVHTSPRHHPFPTYNVHFIWVVTEVAEYTHRNSKLWLLLEFLDSFTRGLKIVWPYSFISCRLHFFAFSTLLLLNFQN